MFENFWNADHLNLAAFAIPAFFLFVGLEYWAARQKNKSVFKFESSASNLTIGIAERLLNLFLTASFYSAFEYVYQHYALFSIPNTWVVWIILLLSTDLVWYWYHRFGHEVNLFWAAHIVHHQSEEFNYTVSARITTLQAIIRNVFWCLLPLFGFHPAMVMVTLVIHGAYSFFTHTQIIGKLGWLEYIFITPSHHRVHHASNEKYLNKNYGDLFVFWDKLFGTFQKEEEEPTYGLTHPLKSHSFVWQHVHYFLELIYAARQTSGIGNKLRVFFGRPESIDQNIRPELEKQFLPRRSHLNSSARYRAYITAQVLAITVVLFLVSLFFKHLDGVDTVASSALILVTLINCGALLEQRTWVYPLEHVRLFILVAYLSYATQHPFLFLGYLAFLVLFSQRYSVSREKFLQFIYG